VSYAWAELLVTPWQARFALVGFLLVGSGITANLLLLQERRVAATSVKGQPPRAAPNAPVRARTLPSHGPETKPQPAVAAPHARPAPAGTSKAASRRPVERSKKERGARPPATTASAR